MRRSWLRGQLILPSGGFREKAPDGKHYVVYLFVCFYSELLAHSARYKLARKVILFLKQSS
jgi:hypothetical protein